MEIGSIRPMATAVAVAELHVFVSNSTLYHIHIGPFSNSGLIAGRDRSSPVVVRFT